MEHTNGNLFNLIFDNRATKTIRQTTKFSFQIFFNAINYIGFAIAAIPMTIIHGLFSGGDRVTEYWKDSLQPINFYESPDDKRSALHPVLGLVASFLSFIFVTSPASEKHKTETTFSTPPTPSAIMESDIRYEISAEEQQMLDARLEQVRIELRQDPHIKKLLLESLIRENAQEHAK